MKVWGGEPQAVQTSLDFQDVRVFVSPVSQASVAAEASASPPRSVQLGELPGSTWEDIFGDVS